MSAYYNETKEEKAMKQFVKLFIFTCLMTTLALPVFADDPFPIYASFGVGDVIFSDVREIEEMSSEYEGDVIGEVDVIAIEELKTTLKIETDVANTVRLEKKISATGTEYCSNSVNEGIDKVDEKYFSGLKEQYTDYIDDVKDSIGEECTAPYGLQGEAAPWKDLSGGASQFVTPFNGNVLSRLGICKEDI